MASGFAVTKVVTMRLSSVANRAIFRVAVLALLGPQDGPYSSILRFIFE
jgi:hypothetical protein